MRRALLIMLTGCAFLLMLSALVVTSEDAAAESAVPVLPANAQSALMPAPSPLADQTGEASARPQSDRIFPICIFASALYALCAPLSRDANGRVLTAMRYENSFYQVFRAEVAGG